MAFNHSGGRLAAGILSIWIVLVSSVAPTYAGGIDPVSTEDPGGGVVCGNCGQTSSKSGTASEGSASNNADGSGSTFDLTYGVPNDGQMYSGQLMTQVVNADGSVSVQTWPIGDYGNGSQSAYATAWNNATIPTGGSASISISETAPNGATFSAGYTVNNFGR